MSVLQRKELEQSPLADLHAIASELAIEGYRSRREESLIGLAERVARQVARSRRPIVLEPMPPNERRIVHLTLQTHPEVTTQSSGEGNQRRITVQPRA